MKKKTVKQLAILVIEDGLTRMCDGWVEGFPDLEDVSPRKLKAVENILNEVINQLSQKVTS